MNVLVAQTANLLARRGIDVDVYTAATTNSPTAVELSPGVTVRTIDLGPGDATHATKGIKASSPDGPHPWATRFAEEVRREAGNRHYDVVHSHYWRSGIAALPLSRGWGIPLVHSAHSLARVKDATRSADDAPEPRERVRAEDRIAAEADRLVAATDIEADQLTRLYGAQRNRICVVSPGVDLEVFTPPRDNTERQGTRRRLGVAVDDIVAVFAGRIQPHKGPRVLVEAVAELHSRDPGLSWQAMIVGGHSGTNHDEPDRLRSLAAGLGIAGRVRLLDPVPAAELADIFRAADVVVVPSHSESFGLVALEAQAVGTPVIAAAVGGLLVAVADGVSGVLVTGRVAADWADAIASVVLDPGRREAMGMAARMHAARFSWDATVDGLLRCYRSAISRS